MKEIESITDPEQRRQAIHLHKHVFTLAPTYSCRSLSSKGAFGPILTARVKALWYSHLAYLPRFEGEDPKSPGSILRLDHLFPSMLTRGSEYSGLRLCDDVMELISSQLSVVHGNPASELLKTVREVISDSLPDELR